MTLPQCTVTCILNDADGTPEVGAVIHAQLSETDHYDGQFVVPSLRSATIDAAGVAVLNLWPNELGTVGTHYNIKILIAGKTIRATAVVPNTETAYLHEIAVFERA